MGSLDQAKNDSRRVLYSVKEIAERLYGVSEWQALSGGTSRDSEETL